MSLRLFVIAALFVIAGLTRNPVVVWHWIPDVETPDLIRGRDDKTNVRDDKPDDSDDRLDDRDDKTEGRGTFAACPTKLILAMVLSLHPSLSLLACLSLRA